ncbi:MAG TPA: TIGR01777 family oxidoreductase [Jatrophihabitans sp.]|nr:TIGR01777 family oxidoreductase [Jatrophihabitans sp.]
MKVVIAGGTGALGRRLADDLAERGHQVVVLTRSPGSGRHREVRWDGRTVQGWADELAGAAVVNLAGELVDRRPSPAAIELLTSSRVEPTRALAEAAAALDRPVPVWIQASTLAIHGDAGEQLLDEGSPVADGPPQMAGVARAWEAAVAGVNTARTVLLRTSLVLDRDTPALDRLTGLARWGLAGRIGSGRQWVSWIHISDWLAIVRWALDNPVHGVVVASSPNPVRNAELMAAVRHAVHRPVAPPTPGFAVRLGSVLLRSDPALALTGRRARPARLLEAGFGFRYPQLADALAELLERR